jgi:hypothetical protein
MQPSHLSYNWKSSKNQQISPLDVPIPFNFLTVVPFLYQTVEPITSIRLKSGPRSVTAPAAARPVNYPPFVGHDAGAKKVGYTFP